MAPWRAFRRGVHALLRRREADRDVADEVRHYLDEAAAAHEARGLSPDAARRAARIELGGEVQVNEMVRGSGWEHTVETATADLRYAGRRLLAAPGFTAITVLTLALGIGATTAIFSALEPVLFEPLPYPEPGRLAAVVEVPRDGGRNAGTFGIYQGFAERAPSLASVAVMRTWQPTITGGAEPERLEGQRVSASYLRTLGVAPAAGRDFQADDDRPGAERVAIISDGLWHRRFGADRAIIGRVVTLDDDAYTVIGIMPPRFENVLAPAAELWTPLRYDITQPSAWGHHLRTVARLRPGVTAAGATRELDRVGHLVLREQRPASYDTTTRFVASPLQAELTRGVRPALLAVLGAVTLLLLIACINVTNLLLARGVQRRGEFALRAALGAGRRRLVRQLLTESLLLALIGGAAGMLVALLGVRALRMLQPPGLHAGAIALDGQVFLFALVVTTVIGLAFGVMPALEAARSDPHDALQQDTRRAAGRHGRTRGALVAAEFALALVLLVSSGLLLRSLQRLFTEPAGFDPSRLLTMQVQVVGHRYDDDATASRLVDRILEAARQVPGVAAAAVSSQLPLSADDDEYGAQFEATPDAAAATYNAFRYAVSPGYLETMRIPLRRGRMLDDRDRAGTPLVAVISEALARERFRDGDPIGRRVSVGATGPYTIVGVVGDVKQLSLGLSEAEAVYVPFAQWPSDRAVSLVVRTPGDPASLAPAVRKAIWSVDKDQPVVRVATMDDLVARSAAERRFALIVFEAFGLAALVLAAAGIYGLLAGSVAERTREMGVRSALGATRRVIVGLVLRQGMRLTFAGLVIGLAGAYTASRAIAALLFGISRADPLTYLGVTALLVLVSLAACLVPAWRAARVAPATALRAE